ncbi:hypothetical protein [Tahibacter amnicola]|uniref:Rop-like protein n=1 Tax=Tahibacter amnicola TaxID=2976241 RepID=A0ABY6BG40_9GAMM|nr:hypothetical protein [Tahibacter amnicola]UXI68991.1 hypothetical protein N4264_04880 [Tahibacter amnicola]
MNNVLNVIAMQAEVANQFAARGEFAACREYLDRLQRECRVAAATVKAYCDANK